MTAPAHFAEPLAHIAPDPVRWLWPNYLPRGKLAILDGDPGVGKSFLALDIAARISRGGYFPDGACSERPHVTLILSGEDSAADTIRPRAEAAGADLENVLVVASTDGALMRFPADLPHLDSIIRERHADLVVIDPIMAFIPPEVASNSDQCVRGPLNLLATVAARNDCTILLIRHLRKKAATKSVHRGLGSIGIIGAVRAGLLVAQHPHDAELRVLAVTKTNLGSMPPALGFRFHASDPKRVGINWTEPLNLTADALGLPVGAPSRPRDHAAVWLIHELAGGPRRANELYALATMANIPEGTLIRARKELGVMTHQVYSKATKTSEPKREWFWYDPCAAWPASAPFPKPFELPPLDLLAPFA